MCSDTLDPGGEVRVCSLGYILGMPEISSSDGTMPSVHFREDFPTRLLLKEVRDLISQSRSRMSKRWWHLITFGHARNIIFCVYRSSYQVHGISRIKEMLFQAGGVLGAAEFRVFSMLDKHDRRYVSVRVACGFNLVKKIFPDAWIANEKGAAEGAS